MGRRDLMIDAGLGGVVMFVVAVAITANIGGSRGPDIGAYMFAVGFGLLMLVRRHHPSLMLLVTTVGLVGYYIADYPHIGLAVPVAAALYSAAEHGKLMLATSVAGFLLVTSTFFRLRDGEDLGYLIGYELAWSVAVMAGAIALGDGVRSRQIRNAEQRRREQELLRASQQETTRRIEHERLSLARDLHDVLAHTTTVISLQADVAREALDDGDIDAAQSALAVIRSASGEATQELRTTVTLLRQPADIAPRVPAGSLEHLDRLVATTVDSGLPVNVHIEGERGPVPTTVDTTAYRIVQEALTNAVRHAEATRVDVYLHYRPGRLDIAVKDNGRGGPSGNVGHGLAGMRERAELIGGTLTTTVGGHGFEVSASLPLEGKR